MFIFIIVYQVPRCSPQISYGVSTACSKRHRHTKSARAKQVGKSLMGTGEVQKGTEQKKSERKV
jgi:hypothetical protein